MHRNSWRRTGVTCGLCALSTIRAAVAATPVVHFDQAFYPATAGSSYSVQILLDADSASPGEQLLAAGLLTFGVRVSFDPQMGSVTSILLPAALNSDGNGGAPPTGTGAGYGQVQGAVGLLDDPYQGSLLATLTIHQATNGYFPLTLGLYQDSIVNDDYFFDGNGVKLTPNDGSLTFGSAASGVVPEPGGLAVLLLGGVGLLYRRRGGVCQSVQSRVPLVDALESRMHLSAAPIITSVQINGGDAQRSMIDSLVVVFSADVGSSLSLDDLSLRNETTGQSIDLASAGYTYTPGNRTATWTFASVSLPDGNYTGVISAAVTDDSGNHLDGNGDGTAGDAANFEFHRYFGDTGGTRSVGDDDLAAFSATYFKRSGAPAFDARFDVDHNGYINFADLVAFRQNYQKKLPSGAQIQIGDDSGTGTDRLLVCADTIPGRSTAAGTYTLSNTGDQPLLITGWAKGGTNPGDFTVVVKDGSGATVSGSSFSIAPRVNFTVQVTFAPGSGTGARSATIAFNTNDTVGNDGAVRLNFRGSAVTEQAWMTQLLNRTVDPTAGRNAEYMAFINATSDNQYYGMKIADLEGSGAVSEPSPSSGSSVGMRDQVSDVARLAFLYATPGSNYYNDPTVSDLVHRGLLAIANHTDSSGLIHWTNDAPVNTYSDANEVAWRLEPELMALMWYGNNLSGTERATVEAAAQRTANWLYTNNSSPELNNRGMVLAAVLRMAGMYFNNSLWTARADSFATTMLLGSQPIIRADGEVTETTYPSPYGGPDANYSYTTISYAYEYRVLSGRTDIDAKLLAAAKWFASYDTISGVGTVPGVSVRKPYADAPSTQDMLPLLEFYSRSEPFLATVAEHTIQKKSTYGLAFWVPSLHIVAPEMWAMVMPGVNTPAEGTPAPAWYTNNTQIYYHKVGVSTYASNDTVAYALVDRQYETGVTLVGRTDASYKNSYQGMQTWAWGDELPIIMGQDNFLTKQDVGQTTFNRSVTILTGGKDDLDSSRTNAAYVANPATNNFDVLLQTGAAVSYNGVTSDLATLAEQQSLINGNAALWTLYVYTPVSTLVVYGGWVKNSSGTLVTPVFNTTWNLNPTYVSQATVNQSAKQVTFAGRQGTISWLTGNVSLVSSPTLGSKQLTFSVSGAASTPPVYGFSDGSLQFGAYNPGTQTLTFSDGSGSYSLLLANMLSGTGLNRSASFRLTKIA